MGRSIAPYEEAAERLISLAEAAEFFELSHSHLRKLVREGKIWGRQIGRYWVTTEEAVREYLAQDRHLTQRLADRPYGARLIILSCCRVF